MKKIILFIIGILYYLNIFSQSPDFGKYISQNNYTIHQDLLHNNVPTLGFNKYGWEHYNVEFVIISDYIKKITISLSSDNEMLYKKFIKNNNYDYDSKIYLINYRDVKIINYKKDSCYYVVYIEI